MTRAAPKEPEREMKTVRKMLNKIKDQATQEGGVVVGTVWVLAVMAGFGGPIGPATMVMLFAMAVAGRRKHLAIDAAAVAVIVAAGTVQHFQLLT